MPTLTEELTHAMANKAALVQMTNTFGWKLVKEIADKVTANSIQEALDAEDETGEPKRLKAKALQQGFADLFNAIESVKQFSPGETVDDGGFGQLEFSNATEKQ